HVIHNGITDPSGSALRREASDQKPVVGIVGQIGEWKGHDDLLEAFALVSSSFPKAELHVFGKGSDDYETNLREKAVALAIADTVIWHGFVTDRTQIYRRIDICVVPSRFEEPFGMTVV